MVAVRTVKIETPSLPNFVQIGSERVDVADLSKSEIDAIGAEWTWKLERHSEQRRRNREQQG